MVFVIVAFLILANENVGYLLGAALIGFIFVDGHVDTYGTKYKDFMTDSIRAKVDITEIVLAGALLGIYLLRTQGSYLETSATSSTVKLSSLSAMNRELKKENERLNSLLKEQKNQNVAMKQNQATKKKNKKNK